MAVMWTENETNHTVSKYTGHGSPASTFSQLVCVYMCGPVLMSAYQKNPRTKEVSFSYATRRVFIDFVCARLAGGAP